MLKKDVSRAEVLARVVVCAAFFAVAVLMLSLAHIAKGVRKEVVAT